MMTDTTLRTAAKHAERRRRYVLRLVKRIEQLERDGTRLLPNVVDMIKRAKSTRGHAFTADATFGRFLLTADAFGVAWDFPSYDERKPTREGGS